MTSIHRSPALVLVVIFGMFAALACAPGASQTSKPTSGTLEPKTLRDSITGPGWSSSHELIAQEKGFYAAENLTVEVNLAGQSAAACQQLLAKAADIAQCSLNDMVQAVEASGAQLIQFFGAYASPLNYSIMAKPNLTTWADLQGQVHHGGRTQRTIRSSFSVPWRAQTAYRTMTMTSSSPDQAPPGSPR